MSDRDIVVREVWLRDGLQSLRTIVPTSAKLRWCEEEAAAGVPEIEVASFVPHSMLPQLADAAEIVADALRVPGLKVTALVPNLRGAQDAVAAGVHKINCVVAVSEGHNRSNLRRSTADALAEIGRIVAFCNSVEPTRRPIVCAGLATCLGCTIDGTIPEEDVRRVAAVVLELGVDELLLADTVGYGNPAAVKRLFAAVRADSGSDVPIGAHFHDTRGTGLANVVAALEVGIREFDASLGGLGGCPYAPGATGNIVTEDLVYMLEAMGLRTGIDVSRLLEIRRSIEDLLPGERFEGTLARAGLPKNFIRSVAPQRAMETA